MIHWVLHQMFNSQKEITYCMRKCNAPVSMTNFSAHKEMSPELERKKKMTFNIFCKTVRAIYT